MVNKNPLYKEAESVLKIMLKVKNVKSLERFGVTKRQFNALCSLPEAHSKTTKTAVIRGFDIYCIENDGEI